MATSNYPPVFVICPFAPPYEAYFGSVYEPAAANAGMRAYRAKDMFKTGNVVSQIVEAISTCTCVIAELSERNPNVYYELGLAHAFGKPTILLSSSARAIPFDLRNLRHVLYDRNDADWADGLRSSITLALQETLDDPDAGRLWPTPVVASATPSDLDDIVARVSLLQASVDAMRGELAEPSQQTGSTATAGELVALADHLVRAGTDPNVIVDELRERGAPLAWARAHVLSRIRAAE